MTAEEREQQLLDKLRPAIFALWDVRYPNEDKEGSFAARVGINNVLLTWIYEQHPGYFAALNKEHGASA